MVPVWRLEDNPWELVPSAVGSRDQTPLMRLAWQGLYRLSRLSSLFYKHWFWELTVGPHTCKASALSTEPSLQSHLELAISCFQQIACDWETFVHSMEMGSGYLVTLDKQGLELVPRD